MTDYQAKAMFLLLFIQIIDFLGVVLSPTPNKAKPWLLISLAASVLIFGVALL